MGEKEKQMVNMIHGGLSGLSPFLLPSLLGDKPKFSGEREDWFTFSKEWENYVGILRATHAGTPLEDPILLKILKGCLDETHKKWLMGKKEAIPE